MPNLRRLVSAAIVGLASTLLIAPTVVAQYTPISTLEAVYLPGSSYPVGTPSFIFPQPTGTQTQGPPITVMGIVLNNPSDMLDTTAKQNTISNNLGGQWQIFIQAYGDSTVGSTPGDFGGCEVWMGQCYGNLFFVGDPSDVYTNSQWNTVVADLNNPPLSPSSGTISLQESGTQSNSSPAVWPSSGTVSLKAGDVVAVTSYGQGYEGMENLNQEHAVATPLSLSVVETGAQTAGPDRDDASATDEFQQRFLLRSDTGDRGRTPAGNARPIGRRTRVLGHLGAQQPGRPQRRHRAADDLEHRQQPGPRGSPDGHL